MKSSNEDNEMDDGEVDYHIENDFFTKLLKLEADGYVRWDIERDKLVVVTQREIDEMR
tara:strand:+ start:271 stop:444 length:174 start_codon:yes stop_codon:yes gene_type:complete